MIVALIAAMDRRGLIGTETGLPWHLPRDLRRFRAITWGKPIIMGRSTFELIGKPLPGRFNIVLTRNLDFTASDCRIVRSLPEGLAIAENHLATTGGEEVLIIGGEAVYTQAMPYWDRCYLTIVDGSFSGNAYFPIQELLQQAWQPLGAPEELPANEKNPHRHSFHIIERSRDRRRAVPPPTLEGLDLAALLTRGHPGP
jgi:dihydrofolate reductase